MKRESHDDLFGLENVYQWCRFTLPFNICEQMHYLCFADM